ncbi:MAG: hypothetical protein AAGH15_24925, partial [Myxococcota bacterium]
SVSKSADELVDRIDPAIDNATKEAERILEKIGKGAEPLARQVGEELGKLGKLFQSRAEKAGLASPGRPDDDDESKDPS